MNPFWAVRRLTPAQLANAVRESASTPGAPRPRYNCEFVKQKISLTTLGLVNGQVTNITKVFEIPFLTNTCDLTAGDELVVATPEKPTTVKKRSRREAMAEEKAHRDKQKKLAKT